MKTPEYFYLFFAVVHPISELVRRTNLRAFLNTVYYGTGKEFFPVSRVGGVFGSVLVLAVLVSPLFGLGGLWCLVVGLTVADTIQHAVHLTAKSSERAPKVHLPTILGVLVLLPWVTELRPDSMSGKCTWLMIVGALLIFGNWLKNSLLVHLLRTGRNLRQLFVRG